MSARPSHLRRVPRTLAAFVLVAIAAVLALRVTPSPAQSDAQPADDLTQPADAAQSTSALLTAASGDALWLLATNALDQPLLTFTTLDQNPPLTTRPAATLDAQPLAIAAHRDAIVLIFPPAESADADESQESDDSDATDDQGASGSNADAEPDEAQAANAGDPPSDADQPADADADGHAAEPVAEPDTDAAASTDSPATPDPAPYRVRRLTTIEYRPGLFGFSDLQPLPPLPAGPAPRQLVLHGDVALLLRDDRSLALLADRRWTPLPSPPGFADGAPLLTIADDATLTVLDAEPAGELDLWTLPLAELVGWSRSAREEGDDADNADSDAAAASPEPAPDAPPWPEPTRTRWLSPDLQPASLLRLEAAAVGKQLLSVVWTPGDDADAPDRLHLSLVRSEQTIARGVLDSIPPTASLAAAQDGLVFAWREPPTDDGARPASIATVHYLTPDAATRFTADLSLEQPIEAHQVHAVLIVLVSIGLTMTLYILRRDADARAPVALPEDASLADPGRRLLAALVDASVALLFTSLVFGEPLRWWTENLFILIAEQGVAPIFVWAGFLAAHSAITEATLGVTVGKAVFRMRTVDRRGRKPSPRLAVVRSIAKAACPFAAVFLIIEPNRPHPASAGAWVIVKHPPQPPADDQPTDTDLDTSDEPESPDDRRDR